MNDISILAIAGAGMLSLVIGIFITALIIVGIILTVVAVALVIKHTKQTGKTTIKRDSTHKSIS